MEGSREGCYGFRLYMEEREAMEVGGGVGNIFILDFCTKDRCLSKLKKEYEIYFNPGFGYERILYECGSPVSCAREKRYW